MTSKIDIDAALVEWSSPDSVVTQGRMDNHEFANLTRTTWSEVAAAIEIERVALPFRDEYFPGDLDVDDVDWAEHCAGLEVGVASAVLALNAAGCPTITSCAGHPISDEDPAIVIFGIWRGAIPRLIEIARASGVSLGNALHGYAEVYSGDPKGLLRFAQALRIAEPDLRDPTGRPEVSVDMDKVRWIDPGSDLSEEDFTGEDVNRDYVDLTGATWANVYPVLDLEAYRLDADLTDEDDDDDSAQVWERVSAGLDCGVAAATLALNAAGFPTIMSCSGHPTSERQPAYVSFCARRDRFAELLNAAREARVGAGNVETRVEVYSFETDGLLRFASILTRRGEALNWDR